MRDLETTKVNTQCHWHLEAKQNRIELLEKTDLALHIEIDAHDVLVDDSSGANVEMAHLGVAHQSGGQAHRQTRSIERQVLLLVRGQLVHNGSVGVEDGVAILLVGHTPAIDHDQTNAVSRLLGVGHFDDFA